MIFDDGNDEQLNYFSSLAVDYDANNLDGIIFTNWWYFSFSFFHRRALLRWRGSYQITSPHKAVLNWASRKASKWKWLIQIASARPIIVWCVWQMRRQTTTTFPRHRSAHHRLKSRSFRRAWCHRQFLSRHRRKRQKVDEQVMAMKVSKIVFLRSVFHYDFYALSHVTCLL